MSRLPPAEKLTLAARKNIRDSWEANKEDLQKQIKDILDVEWTFEVDPLAIAPYAGEEYAARLGDLFKSYFEGAVWGLKYFADHFGDDGKNEINTIVPKHVLGLDVDLSGKYSYCGPEVRDGKLFIVFKPGQLYVNTGDCLARDVLMKALNDAPPTEGATLSVIARADIRLEFDAKIEDTRKKIADMLEKPDFKLNGNFEQVFAKLKEESGKKKTSLRDDWEKVLGYITRSYFEGAEWQLKYLKFDDDEMLREAFTEAVDKDEIAFRIVDKLTGKYGNYCECQIEGGVLYIQTTTQQWSVNSSDACTKIVDVLE